MYASVRIPNYNMYSDDGVDEKQNNVPTLTFFCVISAHGESPGNIVGKQYQNQHTCKYFANIFGPFRYFYAHRTKDSDRCPRYNAINIARIHDIVSLLLKIDKRKKLF